MNRECWFRFVSTWERGYFHQWISARGMLLAVVETAVGRCGTVTTGDICFAEDCPT